MDERPFCSIHPVGKALPESLLSIAWPPSHEGNSFSRCREFSRPTKTSCPSISGIELGQGKRKHADFSCAPACGTGLDLARRPPLFRPGEKQAAGRVCARVPQDSRSGWLPTRAFVSLLHRCFNFSSKFHFRGKTTISTPTKCRSHDLFWLIRFRCPNIIWQIHLSEHANNDDIFGEMDRKEEILAHYWYCRNHRGNTKG